MAHRSVRPIAAVLCLALAMPALAGGRFNMPSSPLQALGVGFGPGYHAPMLLGPVLKAPFATQRVTRLPAPLNVPAGPAYVAPSRLGPAAHGSSMPGFSAWSGHGNAAPMTHAWPAPVAGETLASPADAALPPTAIQPATVVAPSYEGYEVIPAPSN